MTLNDIVNNWDYLKYQKKRAALQAIVNFIDYDETENDEDNFLYGLIKYASTFEDDDYFGTEKLNV